MCYFHFYHFSSSDFVSEIVLWDGWKILPLGDVAVAVTCCHFASTDFVLDNIVYFSFYLFATQQDAVNAARRAAKRLPASCSLQALQGGADAGGVAAAPAGGQMLVAVANSIQNPPLPNIPVGGG